MYSNSPESIRAVHPGEVFAGCSSGISLQARAGPTLPAVTKILQQLTVEFSAHVLPVKSETLYILYLVVNSAEVERCSCATITAGSPAVEAESCAMATREHPNDLSLTRREISCRLV